MQPRKLNSGMQPFFDLIIKLSGIEKETSTDLCTDPRPFLDYTSYYYLFTKQKVFITK